MSNALSPIFPELRLPFRSWPSLYIGVEYYTFIQPSRPSSLRAACHEERRGFFVKMSDRNEQTVKQPRRGLFPPEVIEVVSPSLGIGAIAGERLFHDQPGYVQFLTHSGTFGFATGVAGGIARDATPALFGLSAGIQWFTLGTSYWRRFMAVSAKDHPHHG